MAKEIKETVTLSDTNLKAAIVAALGKTEGCKNLSVEVSANNLIITEKKGKETPLEMALMLAIDLGLLELIQKPVTVIISGAGESKTIHTTIGVLITDVCNGTLERFNTNFYASGYTDEHKITQYPNRSAKGVLRIADALQHGYKSVVVAEKPEKAPTFNWANFIVWLKEQDYNESELAPKIAKFLTLTTRQISSLTDEQLKQVSWLYPLLVERGYTPAKPAEQSLLADLM